ncbi:uncharacterized protein LOC126553840 [Aphis gossypii]|uniref:uncharacterized protein LOC126553840 n=1 Tax=Aphis gossypii TaxID=80765 RepID=UPI0021599017|nr:uncharacterized protein LOC126553840 [Aphis gossypii]
MRVYLAAQIFSESVAAGMSTTLVSKMLPPSAKFTIDFINDMDQLLDIFNSSKIPGLKSFKRPFKNTPEQINHLNKMADVFRNIKVIHKFKQADETKRMNFIKGWLISINGLQMLYTSLNPKQDVNDVLYTGKVNRDCLENLFCTFRQQQGNNLNSTPIQLSWAFKKIFCLNYFQTSPGANCIEDLDQILCSEIVTGEVLSILEPEKNLFKFKAISIGTVDYRNLELLEKNTFTYVCGYIMKKCLEKHICQDCVNYARHQKQLDQSHILSFLKAYPTSEQSTFGNLMVPHNNFYNFIYELENIFIKLFSSISIENGVGSKLRLHSSNVPFSHPCKLFDKSFLINLFIRFRMFTAITFLNRTLLHEKKLKNRKLTILSHL